MWMKTSIHSHFYAIFHEFLWRAIKGTNRLQLYTANISYMVFNPFWCFSSFRLHQIFQCLMIQLFFSQIQQAPCTYFRKVGKSLSLVFNLKSTYVFLSAHRQSNQAFCFNYGFCPVDEKSVNPDQLTTSGPPPSSALPLFSSNKLFPLNSHTMY